MSAIHSIRLLHLEDSPVDAKLIEHRLAGAGIACSSVRVDSEGAFEAALADGTWDLILVDYNLPGYDGRAAVQLAQQRRADVPIIVVSGVLDEEEAVECLHLGAADYILKHRLARLATAVRRALEEAKVRRERRATDLALQESQSHLRRAQVVAHIGSWTVDIKRGVLVLSEESCRIFNMATGIVLSYDAFLERVHPDDRKYVDRSWKATVRDNRPYNVVHRILANGDTRWVRERAELTFDAAGVAVTAIGTIQDITEPERARMALAASEHFLRATAFCVAGRHRRAGRPRSNS